MHERTRRLWDQQNRHPGDRQRLFEAVRGLTGDVPVLYPGSFVDVSASFVYASVIYMDIDQRASRFFSDVSGVDEIIAGARGRDSDAAWRFIPGDYEAAIDLPDASVDLVVSLYAGLISDPCARLLRPGGWLLANPSHGDVALASIDPRYQLGAVVKANSGTYTVSDRHLDQYLIPKRPTEITPESIRERGRGIAYTRSAFAYLFERTSH